MKSAKTVYVGLSGGVDSAVAATLLQRQGYEVVGVYMKNWSADIAGVACPWREDLASARLVVARLGVPLKIYDFEVDYKRAVVDYMVAAYKKGLTPNPDVMCNQEIKFKVFAQKCFEEGADFIATGHYARIGSSYRLDSSSEIKSDSQSSSHLRSNSNFIVRDGHGDNRDSFHAPADNIVRDGEANENSVSSGKPMLKMAADRHKDQTYFLYRMSQEAAQKTLFPLGQYTKQQVRQLAREFKLPNAARRDSQGLCFVGKVSLRDFLGQYIAPKTGDIIDDKGQVVGQHDGAFYYTIGQRHGLGIGGGAPYFVYKKDAAKNVVYVTTDLDSANINRDKFTIADCVWWGEPQSDKNYKVRIRHGGVLLSAKLRPVEGGKYEISLQEPERAIAPGQSAVIYDGEAVLGGGVIE